MSGCDRPLVFASRYLTRIIRPDVFRVILPGVLVELVGLYGAYETRPPHSGELRVIPPHRTCTWNSCTISGYNHIRRAYIKQARESERGVGWQGDQKKGRSSGWHMNGSKYCSRGLVSFSHKTLPGVTAVWYWREKSPCVSAWDLTGSTGGKSARTVTGSMFRE